MSFFHSHHSESMIMTDALAYNSELKNVNPILKTLFSLICVLLCINAKDIIISLVVIFSMLYIICRLGKIPFCSVINLIKSQFVFLLISCSIILIECLKSPIGIFQLKIMNSLWLCITKESLLLSSTIFFQALGAMTCIYFLALTTTLSQLIYVLHKFHIPKLIIELMYLIYRYLFVLLNVQQKMTASACSRLGYNGIKHSLHSSALISGGVLASSFRRCSANLDSMESRCYEGELVFLTHTPKLLPRHILFTVGYITLLIFLILIRKGVILWAKIF